MMFQFFKSSYQKIKRALSKTRSMLGPRISALLGKPWDDSTFEELEQILYEADLGSACVQDFINYLRSELRLHPTNDISTILKLLKKRSLEILQTPSNIIPKLPSPGTPHVILIIGVNGSGKTTSIAKLGLHFKEEGKNILLGAGDTFRAAAIDQLTHWATKIGADIVKSNPGSDPSAVAFDALTAAVARNTDIVLLDTAGRLQNKKELMQELAKTKRICEKVIPGSPHETFLILDATTGQNALDQAKVFHEHVPLTGLILTKLDGSAKGGIILSIYKELKIPIRWIGVGEQAEDLIPFDPESYVEALLEN
ncbi:MAG: signal recognition particle-docking protein FtsY [Verrucomicrobia bacterium]|nr:signal recognition particle-docking protein FtsY [Verrucomicrobiota bacterium]